MAGAFINPRDDTRKYRIFFHEHVRKDVSHTLKLRIRRNGGEIVDDDVNSDVVIVPEEKVVTYRHIYACHPNPAKNEIKVETPDWIKSCLLTGQVAHLVPPKQRMPGRPPIQDGQQRRFTMFTPEDDRHLARYLGIKLPLKTQGGRYGMIAYNQLVKMDIDPAFTWVRRHPAQSWQNRYKTKTREIDAIIEALIEEGLIDTETQARDPRERDHSRTITRRPAPRQTSQDANEYEEDLFELEEEEEELQQQRDYDSREQQGRKNGRTTHGEEEVEEEEEEGSTAQDDTFAQDIRASKRLRTGSPSRSTMLQASSSRHTPAIRNSPTSAGTSSAQVRQTLAKRRPRDPSNDDFPIETARREGKKRRARDSSPVDDNIPVEQGHQSEALGHESGFRDMAETNGQELQDWPGDMNVEQHANEDMELEFEPIAPSRADRNIEGKEWSPSPPKQLPRLPRARTTSEDSSLSSSSTSSHPPPSPPRAPPTSSPPAHRTRARSRAAFVQPQPARNRDRAAPAIAAVIKRPKNKVSDKFEMRLGIAKRKSRTTKSGSEAPSTVKGKARAVSKKGKELIKLLPDVQEENQIQPAAQTLSNATTLTTEADEHDVMNLVLKDTGEISPMDTDDEGVSSMLDRANHQTVDTHVGRKGTESIRARPQESQLRYEPSLKTLTPTPHPRSHTIQPSLSSIKPGRVRHSLAGPFASQSNPFTSDRAGPASSQHQFRLSLPSTSQVVGSPFTVRQPNAIMVSPLRGLSAAELGEFPAHGTKAREIAMKVELAKSYHPPEGTRAAEYVRRSRKATRR